ncbi:Choline-sulfatase [Caulifigura coniformis]|uniref:Choline-sulfatase n=1 Tax=Caulifigura coniformis TaxID=2527983 RepID=A0A517SJ44_9PLAN|nr:sulfatase [Caulifigura coniformis]QDT56142.1 Choline-sulfatase [Caulifigura coniformis]
MKLPLGSRSLPLLLLLVVCGFAAPAVAAPDIVLFIADDLSQRDISPYGAKAFRTPNLQALADAGLTFENAYVASPSCAPSRAALLTGLMPARNGSEANHSRPKAEIRKWPAYFQELGYEVVAYGKVSHYRHTIDYGFDSFAHDKFHEDIAIPEAVKFLRNRGKGSKPLCLLVGTNWPHVPWPDTPEGYDPETIPPAPGNVDTHASRLARARYAAAVTRADRDLGLVMSAVREVLGDQALIAFTSDHGSQWPFGKWNCYEGGVRVPLIVSWPGVTKAASRTSAMVSWIDLLPTLVSVAGGAPSDAIDGRSFVGVLKGTADAHRDAIFTTHSGDGNWNVYPQRGVRVGRWKYIRNLHPEFAFTSHVDLPDRQGNRTYFESWQKAAETDPAAAAAIKRYHLRPAEELFDLDADPLEQQNLVEDPRGKEALDRLRRQLDEWMTSQGDQQTVFGEPRLLTDPTSFGPDAISGDPQARKRAGRKAP